MVQDSNSKDLTNVVESGLEQALSLGATEASVICSSSKEKMVRFSNNSITAVKELDTIDLFFYLTKARRRIIGSTSDLDKNAINKFLQRLLNAAGSLKVDRDLAFLPKLMSSTNEKSDYDKRLSDIGNEIGELANSSIQASMKSGAKRASGSLSTYDEYITIRTSGGAKGLDRRTKVLLNIRAFADGDSSGHGLSCATKLSNFDPEKAGSQAGSDAKRSTKPLRWEEGIYDIILSPTVAADVVQLIGRASSAFAVDSGLSFLEGQVGERVAVDKLTLRDEGRTKGALDSRVFDDEGLPTQENIIINEGILKTYLHNSTTAKRAKKTSTGNAGIIEPSPWNLIVDNGDYSVEEMIRGVKKGMLITNNWYTRFQNYRSGEYSTIPRDATFLIESGKIKYPITGVRISDALPRQLSNITGIGKERTWTEWWEVSTPVLAPYLLIEGARATKANA
ncbi:MAG: TldD/PmbA family protein [Nitrososphaerales archaeon]